MKKTIWQFLNEPFWTPIGLMGWIGWTGGFVTNGWGKLFCLCLMIFALVCWFIRENRAKPKKVVNLNN
jgi:hypothetical protein